MTLPSTPQKRSKTKKAIVLLTLVLNIAIAFNVIAQTSANIKAAKPTAAKQPAIEKPLPNIDASRSQKFAIEAMPTWISTVGSDDEVSKKLPKASLQYHLIDMQTRLEKETLITFKHTITQVNDVSALKDISQIQFEFEPSYETLMIHKIDLLREGNRIDKLDRKKFQILHREQQLERQLLDGRLTASTVLDDVRLGDKLEIAYSIKGANPVFEGLFSDSIWSIRNGGPTGIFQFRLLAPENRDVKIKVDKNNHDISSQMSTGWRETIIRRKSVPQYQHDESTPESEHIADYIQFSEYKDWAHVASWSDKVFATAYAKPTEAIVEQARQLSSLAGNDPQARIRATLDFVQKQIRYFGTETGVNSHRPAVPELTLKQRYGDCKDKTSLLISLLKAQNIDAHALLVNTNLRGDIVKYMPSPLLFDHVIAQVQVNNKTWTLDATSAMQSGSINERQADLYGAGLSAKTNITGLTQLPSFATETRQTTINRVIFKSLAVDPTLETENTYYGATAENVRAWLSSPRASELQKQFESDISKTFRRAILRGEMVSQDLPDQNAVRISMKYDLPDYLQLNKQKSLADEVFLNVIADALRVQNQSQKTKATFISKNLGKYIQTVEIHLPQNTVERAGTLNSDEVNSNFEFRSKIESVHNLILFTATLEYKTDRIPARAWNGYLDTLKKTWPKLSANYTIAAFNSDTRVALEKQLKTIDEDRRRGVIKSKTEYQGEAHARIAVANARLSAGRLSPKNRASILIDKGIQQDAIGQNKEAEKTFEEAIRLDPTNAEAFTAQAVNALILANDEQVLSSLTKAQSLDSSQFEFLQNRALALYYSGKANPAREELLNLLKKTEYIDKGYPALWLYVVSRQLGMNGIEELNSYSSDRKMTDWPFPIHQALSGAITFDQALTKARENKAQSAGQSTELYFFIAQKQLADKQISQAKESLKAAIDLGVYEFLEYGLAQRELKKLVNN